MTGDALFGGANGAKEMNLITALPRHQRATLFQLRKSNCLHCIERPSRRRAEQIHARQLLGYLCDGMIVDDESDEVQALQLPASVNLWCRAKSVRAKAEGMPPILEVPQIPGIGKINNARLMQPQQSAVHRNWLQRRLDAVVTALSGCCPFVELLNRAATPPPMP